MLLGLVTATSHPDLTPDNALILEPLTAVGIHAAAAAWDDPSVDWKRFDGLLLRQPWNYYQRPAEFRTWLTSVAAPIRNRAEIILWNMDKHYLLELESLGVPLVETAWIDRSQEADLAAILSARGWDDAVVKPAVSAGAWRSFRVTSADPEASAAALAAVTADSDAMVQPFLDSIVEEGEWSFVFFDGSLSHTLIKRAAPGDWRVQERYQGTTTLVADPPTSLVRGAERVLEQAPDGLLYARVDGVRDGDQFVLMELEVFEPVLYLGCAEGSADKFAAAIAASFL